MQNSKINKSKDSPSASLTRTVMMFSLSLTLLIITGCFNTTPTIKEVNYHVGSDGIILDLVNDDSLDEVYEDSNIPLSLSLENLGAYDVVGEQQAIMTIGFDPFFIEPDNTQGDSNIEFGKSNAIVSGISLIGKSRYAPTGSKTFMFFPYLKTKPIEGQRASPETQVFASICYPYATTYSSLVCIDYDAFGEPNTRTQVCRQQDLSASNQGAPVAVTLVEVDNYRVGQLVKPIFTIHINNVGDGTVIKPFETSTDFRRVCAAEGVDTADFNTVGVEAWLSNNIRLNCAPETVKLTRGQGIARCEVSDDDLDRAIPVGQNYQAPLTINLSYIYLSTLRKDIEIKRIDPNAIIGSGSGQNGNCETFQVNVGGQCISKCEFCTQNPGDSACQPSNSRYNIEWNPQFACACSAKTCDTLYPKGLCVPNTGYCATASYCCSNACPTNQIRHDSDGKCYPNAQQHAPK